MCNLLAVEGLLEEVLANGSHGVGALRSVVLEILGPRTFGLTQEEHTSGAAYM